MLAERSYEPTAPFGRRPLSLAHVKAQIAASARAPDKIVHKWRVFRAICAGRPRLHVPERALAVLNALMSFYPETTLSGDALIVFPSNAQLALRAHGMEERTMRRHLAHLVDAGLVIRRDSPNGKRYARKGREGEIWRAFGFDLSPLVARADEFDELAESVEAEARALSYARERVTLCRRDIAKMIAAGIEAGVPTRREGQGPADWHEVHRSFRALVEGVPRAALRPQIEETAEALSQLADDVRSLLEKQAETSIMSGNGGQDVRHKQNSNLDSPIELEPSLREGQAARAEPNPQKPVMAERSYPLGMVLSACPDIVHYAKGGISHWRDLLAAASVVRSALGVSPSAWEEAQTIMGETQAAIVIAAVLQRGAAITSAGGYLRKLTRKAQNKEFAIGPMLMALIAAKRRPSAVS